ncbi:hypothetical protein EVAR_28723_1 [Eumeta japonica]|uniref:Uncharacterized protein n=1 Tax=Eumeta variegata TaxID=151549 RepID=A0A4C1V5N3_EUMVA|nr:hypothetical protein EVAR_28723_1 [Eumeta japonica]
METLLLGNHAQSTSTFGSKVVDQIGREQVAFVRKLPAAEELSYTTSQDSYTTRRLQSKVWLLRSRTIYDGLMHPYSITRLDLNEGHPYDLVTLTWELERPASTNPEQLVESGDAGERYPFKEYVQHNSWRDSLSSQFKAPRVRLIDGSEVGVIGGRPSGRRRRTARVYCEGRAAVQALD